MERRSTCRASSRRAGRQAVVAGVLALLVLPLLSLPVAPGNAVVARTDDESRARTAIAAVAPELGIDASTRDLQRTRTVALGGGARAVRFQQVRGGLPVYGGELVVALDAHGAATSVTGETAPDGAASAPTVPAAKARDVALSAARRSHGAVALSAGPAVAFVYDPALLDAPGPVRTVWRVVVAGPPSSGAVVEVLVDARSGAVVAAHDRSADLVRSICDDRNDPDSHLAFGSWCTQTDQDGYRLTTVDASTPEALRAYDTLGQVSALYADVLGVDLTKLVGLDTARPYAQRTAPELTATVRFCLHGSRPCPYANAFWTDADPSFRPAAGRTYPGGQLYLGDGFEKAPDVIGHEVTHGVTSAVNGLLYDGQSGAINESMSDVFGELTQLYDPATHRFVLSRDRAWLLGEDLDGGAVRSMSNPASLSLPDGDPQPDRMTSAHWETGSRDSGGVHTNSGVGNKTAYLIARGGTFAKHRVTGVGPVATARIYWRAQNLLTAAASYRTLAIDLALACDALYGTASATCRSVRAATAATQMSTTRVTLTGRSSVRAGRRFTLTARMLTARGAQVYVAPSQPVRLRLYRRYVGSKRWVRLWTVPASVHGVARWRVKTHHRAVYEVVYGGSLRLGLAGTSGTHRVSRLR